MMVSFREKNERWTNDCSDSEKIKKPAFFKNNEKKKCSTDFHKDFY